MGGLFISSSEQLSNFFPTEILSDPSPNCALYLSVSILESFFREKCSKTSIIGGIAPVRDDTLSLKYGLLVFCT